MHPLVARVAWSNQSRGVCDSSQLNGCGKARPPWILVGDAKLSQRASLRLCVCKLAFVAGFLLHIQYLLFPRLEVEMFASQSAPGPEIGPALQGSSGPAFQLRAASPGLPTDSIRTGNRGWEWRHFHFTIQHRQSDPVRWKVGVYSAIRLGADMEERNGNSIRHCSGSVPYASLTLSYPAGRPAASAHHLAGPKDFLTGTLHTLRAL
ncbi:hypothetical protein QBC47DRAFT_60339 [Echria macrotheca]|uniref:Uncharacterized protein n=1 Tax=Echria macrotheca TaxID=438768 RepID=A0AAJ0F3R0_9PEZI|nr:hypothetical protein QBC47DRAFT_60339 [Echria macrotheca]